MTEKSKDQKVLPERRFLKCRNLWDEAILMSSNSFGTDASGAAMSRRGVLKSAAACAAAAFVSGGCAHASPAFPASDHWDPASGRFHALDPMSPAKNVFGALWTMSVHEREEGRHPLRPLPVARPDWDRFLAPQERPQYVWLGHSSILMRQAGVTIAVDPVVGESVSPVPMLMHRFQAPPVALSDFPAVDATLITHSHYDHLEEPTVRALAARGSRFVCPLGVGEILRDWGIASDRICELDWWESEELAPGLSVTAVPGRHMSGRGLTDQNRTLWCGYFIAGPGGTTYCSGDTSWGRHFAMIRDRFPAPDVAFIENGQYNERWRDVHMFPGETAMAAKTVRAGRFVPIHWGAYSLALHAWNASVIQSTAKARELGVSPLTPHLGEVFDRSTVTTDWFDA